MTSPYLTSIRVEILKYKRTYALALAVLAPLFISALYNVIFFFKGDRLLEPGTNNFAGMLTDNLNTASGLFFPFYIILLAVLIHHIEHKSSSLKDLFSFPVSRFNAYLSKWIIAGMLISASLVLYFVFNVLGALIVSFKYPALVSLSLSDMLVFGRRIAIVAISSMLLFAIQFLISLKWSNIVVPFGIGMAGFISGMVLIRGWKYVHFHPFVTGYLSFSAENAEGNVSVEHFLIYNSLGFVVLFFAGFLLWCKRRIV